MVVTDIADCRAIMPSSVLAYFEDIKSEAILKLTGLMLLSIRPLTLPLNEF